MSLPPGHRLRLRLTARYLQLRARLSGMLGSTDNATAALNEAWLQLEHLSDASKVADDDAYLLGMAVNIAYSQHRKDAPYLSAQELSALFEYADPNADTERIVAARQSSERLMAVLQTLPVRRRAILVAARLHGESNKSIAERYGVSVKTVERELLQAVRACQHELSALPQTSTSGRIARRS